MTGALREAGVRVGRAAKGIRVAVVDDSAVIRGLVTRWLDAEPDITVVASYADGAQAVSGIPATRCDVVVLDIEMPRMDGLTALPRLVAAVPGVRVIMSSTLTLRNADISMKALSLGASDYVPKPETVRGVSTSEEFRRELVGKVRELGLARRRELGLAPPAARARRAPPVLKPMRPAPRPAPGRAPGPAILAFGSSTGGPNALFEVLKPLRGALDVPVIITQHMPPMFTSILAEHIAKATGLPTAEGKDGERLEARHVYVAPGDYHMRVKSEGTNIVLALDQGPRVNFCRPSVDPMFESVAEVYGERALCVVLTGMGHDGRDGAGLVRERGGQVLAQDEASSVVWGMPGAVAESGYATAVLPLSRIAAEIGTRLKGGAR